MKKIACCFSDITGTIIGKRSNTTLDYRNFNDILLKVMQINHADFILFSLISTDHEEVIMNQQIILSEYLNWPIYFGKHFFENGYIDQEHTIYQNMLGKPYVINRYVEELLQKYWIQKIYFIDDCEMYHEMLFFFAEDGHWDQLLHSIIPREQEGLGEINRLLKREIAK